MLEYVVFFGLLLIGIGFYIWYELQPKQEQPYIDHERMKTESPIELRVYDALSARGEYIKTQYPIGKYRIDIALPTQKIAVECDGKQWHSSKEQKARDRRRDIHLYKKGWITLRFSGKQIYRNLPSVIKRIEEEKKKCY